MNLETYQRGLQRLITHGYSTSDDSAYLQGLVGTSRLAVAKEVVCFWRAYELERFCILTAGLLKSMGRFENDIERFISTEKFSPFIEEAGLQFLRFMASDNDLTVAALAQTEIAFHDTRTNIDEEKAVDWPCNPEPVLLAIINRNDISPEMFAISHYRLRVCRALLGGYICELAL
jgi:hypothetical protein